MENPRRQAWMYLIAGLVAIPAGAYFLLTSAQESNPYALLDWAILGMGIVAVFRGVKGFIDLRRSEGDSLEPKEPGPKDPGPRKLPRPGPK